MKFGLSSTSAAELESKLRLIDIAVTLEHGLEKQHQCEIWCICRFMASIARGTLLSFPLNLIGSERPDFILHLKTRRIGIEITEACNEDYQWARQLSVGIKDSFLEPSMFAQRVKILKGSKYKPAIGLPGMPLTGRGRQGNESDEEWIKYVSEAIAKKSLALKKTGFERLDEDWLLIYVNAPTGPIHPEYLIPRLEHLLDQYWLEETTFNRIAIESQKLLFLATKNQLETFPILDLWEEKR